MKAVHTVTGEGRRLILADDTDTVYLFDRDVSISTSEALKNISSAHTTFKKTRNGLQCAPLAIGPTNVVGLLCKKMYPSVLIGGLGLGGAAEQLTRLYGAKVTSVDILRPMIDMYRAFKKLYTFDTARPEQASHKIVCTDFFDILSRNKVPAQGYWDTIFFDCFLGDDGPNTTKRISDTGFHSSLLNASTKQLIFNMCILDESEEREWQQLQRVLAKKYYTAVIECPQYLTMPAQQALVASVKKIDMSTCHKSLQKYAKKCKVLS
jgi:hypothetical protein